jgi:L-asparagine transporter-like permease
MAKKKTSLSTDTSPGRLIGIPVWTAYMVYTATAVLLLATIVDYFVPSIYMFVLKILAIIGLVVACIVMILAQFSKKK